MRNVLLSACLGAVLLQAPAVAQNRSHVAAPGNLSDSLYNGPVSTAPASGHLNIPTGLVQVGIKLQDPPLVVAVGANAKQNGIRMTAAQQRAYLAQLKQKQDAVMSQVRSLGGVELGRVSKSHNAIFVSIDARQLQTVHGIGGVVAVRPVRDYKLSLGDQTLPYIGATSVQSSGATGQGIRVAMLDTGIDYTHYNLGGSGNVADYQAAKAVATGVPPVSLFPTGKVIGGFDFVGDAWPNAPLAPDPNPIDIFGHGSRTADIVGGRSNDGLHVGVAPGTQLYAVKVCSSVSTSCSGVAILEGIDFALDPKNTGTLNDAVDIISMSVGASFGQREADDSEAFIDVVSFGVVSVVSAGNDGDIPYVLAGPAAAPEVLAVAATNSASAIGIPLVINSPASIAGTYPNTAQLDFAPITAAVTGDIVYVGRGCPAAGTTPDDPYLANPSGKIALIDRGSCAISLKVDRAAHAGAIAVLIGLVAPGDAVSFAFGGGTTFVPSLVITQSTSNLIKNALAGSPVNATISPANAIALSGNVASYSSRGPNFSYNMLKPDLSAPGTVVAADVGTGHGESPDSGTSFSCPLAAGSAALLLSQNRSLGPLDVKALLMESSETAVFNNAATQPGVLAPMSRMGAGELRVDRAAAASTAVWDASAPLAVSLSFGTFRLNANQTYKKKVVIRNYSNSARTYTIANVFRDAPNLTGVTLTAPASIFVPPNSSASFGLTLSVNVPSLPAWTLNGGSQGSNGELLNTVEYAGYLTFTSGSESVHLPWHILPHKAANVQPSASLVTLSGNPAPLTLSNTTGAVNGSVSAFSLTGTGTQFPASALPAPGEDYAVINLKAVGLRLICLGGCTTATPSFGVQFAVNTFGQRSHPDVPAEFDVYIDVNNDGNPDLVVFNTDIGRLTTGFVSGQNGIFVADIAAGTAVGPYFYASADLDSANMILTAPLSALKTNSGLQLTVSTPFNFLVLAFDNYFTGNLTDLIGPMKYELDMPQFYASDVSVPAGNSSVMTIFPNNAANVYFSGPYNGNSPSQTGLLLMYQDGLTGKEAATVTVLP